MQYNGPFDQPTNPNASYTNGNPSTGTNGSIPPAAAIEYPQREIVATIQAAGLTPSNSDLTQLSKAIQNGAMNACTATGTATALVASITPVPNELTDGFPLIVRAPLASTGPSTLILDGLGLAAPIITPQNGAVTTGTWLAGAFLFLLYDEQRESWQLAGALGGTSSGGGGVLVPLQVNTTYYVNPVTGNDNNNGLTALTAWADLNYAYQWLQQNINANGKTITISCAFPNSPTNYAPFVATGGIVGVFSPSQLQIIGDTTSQNCLITNNVTSSECVLAQNLALLSMSGFKFVNSGAEAVGVAASTGAQIDLTSCYWGSCTYYAIATEFSGSNITLTGTNTFVGSYLSIFHATLCSTLNIQGSTVLTDATVSVATVTATDVSVVAVGSNVTFGGSGTTGARYQVASNSVIDTNGSASTYLPGNSGGSTASGGQYV